MRNSFFETIRCIDGEVCNIEYHQQRYESVLKSFGMWEFQDLNSLLAPPQNGLYRSRLVYTLDNPHTIDISYHKYKKRDIKSLKIIHNNTIKYDKKATCRDELNDLFSQRGSCDDVLIIKNSFVTDTSIANVAFYDGSVWLSPKSPLLKGTTRQRLLDTKKIIEADIRVQDIKSFEKIALFNAMIDFDIIPLMKYEEQTC